MKLTVKQAEHQGYRHGRDNKPPIGWTMFPREHQVELRDAYRRGYDRGWRELMHACREES